MNANIIGKIMLIVGVILLLLSVFADVLGGAPGFGQKQIIGTVLGLILAVIGYLLNNKK